MSSCCPNVCDSSAGLSGSRHSRHIHQMLAPMWPTVSAMTLLLLLKHEFNPRLAVQQPSWKAIHHPKRCQDLYKDVPIGFKRRMKNLPSPKPERDGVTWCIDPPLTSISWRWKERNLKCTCCFHLKQTSRTFSWVAFRDFSLYFRVRFFRAPLK